MTKDVAFMERGTGWVEGEERNIYAIAETAASGWVPPKWVLIGPVLVVSAAPLAAIAERLRESPVLS
jgi:hypothetical protein